MSLLESHLALLEREVGTAWDVTSPQSASTIDEAVGLHVALYEILERRIGPNGLGEEHRALVPLFQRWLDGARLVVKRAAEAPHRAAQLDDLVRAINRAKPAAEHFDRVIELNRRTVSAQRGGTYRPLNEVLDGVRNGAEPRR